jgi:hypothetical protein
LVGLNNQPSLLVPWNQTVELVIEKYIIPAECKARIRLELIANGWHQNYLYVNNDKVLNEICDECKALRNSLIG